MVGFFKSSAHLISVSKFGIFLDAFREFLPLVLREFHLSIPLLLEFATLRLPDADAEKLGLKRSPREKTVNVFFPQQSKAFGAALGCVLACGEGSGVLVGWRKVLP